MTIKIGKNKNYLVLGTIPVLMLILNFLFLKDIDKYFMSCIDPQYAYLLNGLNLASGNLEIGHLDHPGTPLQLFYAIIIKATFLFGDDRNIVESVLINPERYLTVISYAIVLFNSIVVYLLGYFTLRQTRNINSSVFLQFTPIISYQSIFSITMISCESVLLPLSMVMVVLALNHTFNNKEIKSKSYIFGFSVVSALLIATKVSSFPLILLPLFLLKSIINKMKFILISSLFTFILIIPILGKFHFFLDFILSLATHLGQFGKGQQGVIDLKDYTHKLLKIFTTELPFSISYFLVFITFLLIIFKNRLFQKTDNKIKNLIYGIYMAMTFQILLVAKHYSFHYLIPVYTLSVLGVFTIFIAIRPRLVIFQQFKQKWISLSLAFLVIMLFIRIIILFNFYPKIQNPTNQTIEFLEKYKNVPKIIMADRYKESAFIEQALFFGVSYSGERKEFYKKYLSQKYPQTYFYSIEEEISGWKSSLMKEMLMSKYSRILLYIRSNNNEQKENFINSYMQFNFDEQFYSLIEIYNNSKTHENIFLMNSDTASIRKLIHPGLDIRCDLETVSADSAKFMDSSDQFSFDKAHLRNSLRIHSGKYSISLNKENPYGLDTRIKIKPGRFVQIQAWVYPRNSNGYIACTSEEDLSFFKCGRNSIRQTEDGWELIELSFHIPESFKDNQINIFFWNSGTESIYIDDINIKIFD